MQSSFFSLLGLNRNYRNLTLAFAVSLCGDWFSTLAIFSLLGWLDQGKALAIAAVLIIKQLPLFLFSLPAGVLADRVSRIKIMMFSDLGRAAVVMSMLLFSITQSFWLLYLLLCMQAVLSAFFEPARSALTPDLVHSHDLLNANALHSMLWSFMLVFGAALGGIVTELCGWQLAIVLDAGSYLLSAFFLSRVQIEKTDLHEKQIASDAPRSTLADLKGFIKYLAQNAQVRSLCFLKGVYGIGGAMILMLTVFGQQVYPIGSRGALGVSLLYIARGCGALLGPLLSRALARNEELRMRRLIFFALIFLGFFYACFGLCTNIWLAMLCIAFAHMLGSSIWVLSTILLQLNVASELRGRAFGLELGAFTFTFSSSTLLYAWLIDNRVLDARLACVVLGLSWFISALWWYAAQRHWKPDADL